MQQGDRHRHRIIRDREHMGARGSRESDRLAVCLAARSLSPIHIRLHRGTGNGLVRAGGAQLHKLQVGDMGEGVDGGAAAGGEEDLDPGELVAGEGGGGVCAVDEGGKGVAELGDGGGGEGDGGCDGVRERHGVWAVARGQRLFIYYTQRRWIPRRP